MPGHERCGQELNRSPVFPRMIVLKSVGNPTMPLPQLTPRQLDHVEVGCHKQHSAGRQKGRHGELAHRGENNRAAHQAEACRRRMLVALRQSGRASSVRSRRCVSCVLVITPATKWTSKLEVSGLMCQSLTPWAHASSASTRHASSDRAADLRIETGFVPADR